MSIDIDGFRTLRSKSNVFNSKKETIQYKNLTFNIL